MGLTAAGRYYQKHAFENRVNIMILHSTVNRPLCSVYGLVVSYESLLDCLRPDTTKHAPHLSIQKIRTARRPDKLLPLDIAMGPRV